MEKYPKEVKLKNGSMVELRLLKEDDLPELVSFYQALPLEDRLFLRSDVMDRENIYKRFGKLDYKFIYPLIACNKHELIAIGSLFRDKFGWKRNLGKIRFVIRPDFQKQGLCTLLIRELFFHAITTDLYKIKAEVIEDQESAIFALKKMGFVKEAVLQNHVLDIKNRRCNLVIMSLDIQGLWNLMEDFIEGRAYPV